MKGNVIVGQSGGPTAVINSSLAGVYRTAVDRGAKKVYGMLYGIQGLLDEQYVDLSKYIRSDLDVEILKRTPSAFLGTCRYKLPDIHENQEIYVKIFEILNKLNIECFIYIGGNDSMDTIKKLSDYAILTGQSQKFVGVPKTIDNDLPVTDHTPGYGSAAKYVASTVREISLDASVYQQPAVTIVELMGRHAGWVTAASALARKYPGDNPLLIYMPEVPFSMEQFFKDVEQALSRQPNVVICVSEGIRDKKGRFICEYTNDAQIDTFGHKMLTGCAKILESYVRNRFRVKVRSVELNVNQRCSSLLASAADVEEAECSGRRAAEKALQGETGKMVTCSRLSGPGYELEYGLTEVGNVCNREKSFPVEWITAEGSDIGPEFLDYALPLIQGQPDHIMENGLPKYLYRK